MATTATTAATLPVTIVLTDKGNPFGKLADAELHLTDGPLSGLKLIGFSPHRRIAAGRAGRAGSHSERGHGPPGHFTRIGALETTRIPRHFKSQL
jgi:hypothetical protein